LANIKSQIKRNRQNDKHRLRNRVYRGEARTAIKSVRAAIDEGNAETSKAELLRAISMLDRAAQKGVLHKNNAARRKSRLMKAYAAMKPVEVKVEEPAVEAVAEPKKRGQAKGKAAKPAAAAASPKGKKPAVEEAPAKAAKGKKPAAEKPAAKPKKPAAKKPATKTKKPAAKK
jgi:small subunit ribosomal protein S20